MKLNVPFPLFPDEDLAINEKLGTELTPTSLGIRFLDDGSHVVFQLESGAFGEVPEFLSTLLRKSQLWERC